MTITLQIDDRTIAPEELVPLLAHYQIIPHVMCESIDRAIASIRCTSEETAQACIEFYQQKQFMSELEQQQWRSRYGLTQEQLELLATRQLRIKKFKEITWGHKLESYFLKRKQHLDQIVYSIIQVQDKAVANELFFRIYEGEQSFVELACRFSQGTEASRGGRVGPIELGNLPAALRELLCSSPVGKVQPPIPFGSSYAIFKVEKLIPSQLDEQTAQRLLHEQFEIWLQEQIDRLPEQDKCWMRNRFLE